MDAVGQDVIVTLTAIAAGAWLLQRWIHGRRAGARCDRCSAMLRMKTRRPSSAPPISNMGRARADSGTEGHG